MNPVVFLGGGRITNAILAGLRLAHYRGRIVVHDRHPQKMRQLQRLYGISPEPELTHAVEQAKMLIIAVRPSSVPELLAAIAPPKRSLFAVSLAAGIPVRNLRTALGPPVRWARAMPSPVCRYGRGLTALTFDQAFPASARRAMRDLFSQVGSVLEIPEARFDAFTVTYSSSHGYHALQALAQAAQKLGLDRKTALVAAAHALADGVVAWREAHVPLAHLLREAATPGGIAAKVMQAMNSAGYKSTVERGLRAGAALARRNARR